MTSVSPVSTSTVGCERRRSRSRRAHADPRCPRPRAARARSGSASKTRRAVRDARAVVRVRRRRRCRCAVTAERSSLTSSRGSAERDGRVASSRPSRSWRSSKLPSGRRFVAVPGAKSFPLPLKSFDCFACIVHVASCTARASIVTSTSAKTLAGGSARSSRAELDDVADSDCRSNAVHSSADARGGAAESRA